MGDLDSCLFYTRLRLPSKYDVYSTSYKRNQPTSRNCDSSFVVFALSEFDPISLQSTSVNVCVGRVKCFIQKGEHEFALVHCYKYGNSEYARFLLKTKTFIVDLDPHDCKMISISSITQRVMFFASTRQPLLTVVRENSATITKPISVISDLVHEENNKNDRESSIQ